MSKKFNGSTMIETGIDAFLSERLYESGMPDEHTAKTAVRVTAALAAMTSGYDEDAHAILAGALFPEYCDEMVQVSGIAVNSMCVHHLLPFVGRAHVAYIPGKKNGDHQCVGLSKIPRMVSALSRRLQTQERLTSQIADIFVAAVNPAGVAVHIMAFHSCMSVRGAMAHSANTQTTAMRGCMRSGEPRAEFLASLNRVPLVLL